MFDILLKIFAINAILAFLNIFVRIYFAPFKHLGHVWPQKFFHGNQTFRKVSDGPKLTTLVIYEAFQKVTFQKT